MTGVSARLDEVRAEMTKLSAATRRLTPAARRGGQFLLCGAALLGVAMLLPWLWYAGAAAEASAARQDLAALAARAERLSGSNAPRFTEADRPEQMFLTGSTAGTTLASFQALVGEAAQRSGLSVLRMQPLPEPGKKGLSPTRLSVDMTGSLEQLRAFFADIESMLPIVIVRGFDIAPQQAEAVDHPSESLAVSLRLEAYGWSGAP